MNRVQLAVLLSLAACNGKDPVTDDVDPTPTDETPPTTPPEPPTPPCRPELVPSAATHLEGDTVELSLACVTGVSGEAYVPRLVTAPDGATLDASWTISFPTDLADAGPHEVFVAVDVAGGVAENAALTVWVDDAGPGVAGNVPPDPAVYTQEFGLPVIWCEPAGAVGASDVSAACAVDGENFPTSTMRIEGPAYPKPSYAIDFGGLIDGEALDMHDRSTLVLLGNFDDNSHVRDKLAHDLWKDLEDFWELERPTPDTTYVVLYVAGAYAGLYVALEPVDDELLEHQGLLPANVYRSVSDDANFSRLDALGGPKGDLSLGWTKVEGGAGEADLEALTAWAHDSTSDAVAVEASARLRVDEFMDWYLLASYAAAAGSAGNRAFLYNDPIVGDDFRYIVGDYVGSFGQSVTTERTPVGVFDDFRVENRIFDHLHASSQLSFTLWARFEQAAGAGGPLDTPSIEARLDEYFALIDPSARRDEAVWGDAYAAWWSGRSDLTDFEGEKAYVHDWVAGRRAAYDAARP